MVRLKAVLLYQDKELFHFGDKLTFFLYKYVTWYKATQIKSTLTWDPKWTQTGVRFHFGTKFHFVVRELHYQHSHDFGRSQTHFGANFTLVKLDWLKLNFKPRWVVHVNSKYPQWNKVRMCTCPLLLLFKRKPIAQHLFCIN